MHIHIFTYRATNCKSIIITVGGVSAHGSHDITVRRYGGKHIDPYIVDLPRFKYIWQATTIWFII